jgi:hypothetical protein
MPQAGPTVVSEHPVCDAETRPFVNRGAEEKSSKPFIEGDLKSTSSKGSSTTAGGTGG